MQIEICQTLIAFCVCLDFPDHALYNAQANQLIQFLFTGQNLFGCSSGGGRKVDLGVLDILVDINYADFSILRANAAQILTHDNLIQDVSDFSDIGEVRVLSSDIRDVKHPTQCGFADRILALFEHQHGDFPQLFARVIGEVQGKLDSGFKTGIDREHLLHLVPVTGKDDTEFSPMIFHGFNERIDSFSAIVCNAAGIGIIRQCISFVDKQHSPHCSGDHGSGLFCSGAKVFTHKAAAIYLNDFLCRENLILVENAGNQTCNFCFAATGIPQKAHVDIQGIAVLVHEGICLDLLYTFFDPTEADQLIELLLAFADFQQTLFIDSHHAEGIQFNHLVI